MRGQNTLQVGKMERGTAKSEKQWNVTKGGGGRSKPDVIYERARMISASFIECSVRKQ